MKKIGERSVLISTVVETFSHEIRTAEKEEVREYLARTYEAEKDELKKDLNRILDAAGPVANVNMFSGKMADIHQALSVADAVQKPVVEALSRLNPFTPWEGQALSYAIGEGVDRFRLAEIAVRIIVFRLLNLKFDMDTVEAPLSDSEIYFFRMKVGLAEGEGQKIFEAAVENNDLSGNGRKASFLLYGLSSEAEIPKACEKPSEDASRSIEAVENLVCRHFIDREKEKMGGLPDLPLKEVGVIVERLRSLEKMFTTPQAVGVLRTMRYAFGDSILEALKTNPESTLSWLQITLRSEIMHISGLCNPDWQRDIKRSLIVLESLDALDKFAQAKALPQPNKVALDECVSAIKKAESQLERDLFVLSALKKLDTAA